MAVVTAGLPVAGGRGGLEGGERFDLGKVGKVVGRQGFSVGGKGRDGALPRYRERWGGRER
jgi:hypothetical protein